MNGHDQIDGRHTHDSFDDDVPNIDTLRPDYDEEETDEVDERVLVIPAKERKEAGVEDDADETDDEEEK